jgi:cytoskeletal protein CcmA (bactofilin family)
MFQKSSPSPVKEEGRHIGVQEDAVETVVGPSVVVEGDFSSEGNIIVKGTVSGSVHTSKMLRVEEGAKIFANVKAGHAVVAGTIRGNVKISDRLELVGTARIAGDVECAVLVVEAGALMHGKIAMTGMEGEERGEKKNNFGRMKAKLAERDDAAGTA